MFEVEEWLHSRIGLNFRSGLGRMQQAGAWQKSCDLYLPSYRLYQ
ncbi:dihydrofolate synthetase [Streptococcus pneumoniae]|nr:dihydrofolate synthetase [Streptococcus pneumoniae]